jgi:poly-gamma-glutamate capsule biosynthesis protein CapA/YwtB (metallophosphatase superfamily)
VSNFLAISNRTTRRKAYVLIFAGTFSFFVGLGYGSAKRYEYIQEFSFVEPVTDVLPDFHLKPEPPAVTIKIKAVGDIVPGTNYPNNRLHSRSKTLFQGVKPLLKGADILFGNFESTLTNYPYSPKGLGGRLIVAFRTPPSYTQILKEAGFDVMSVANNHSFDFARQGFNDSIHNLEKANIKALGKKGQILIAKRKGLSIAWIGFSYFNYHNSLNNLKEAKALVQKASKNADMVVISVHAGSEGTGAMNVRNQTEYFFGENRGNMVQFSRTMIDNGADLILGHGPHVPRALELYKGKLIAYSLGNFMGYRTLSAEAQLAYSLVLETELNNQGDFVSGKIIPVHLTGQGIPYPDRQFRSVKLIRQLTQSNFPKTRLTIDTNGRIRPK